MHQQVLSRLKKHMYQRVILRGIKYVEAELSEDADPEEPIRKLSESGEVLSLEEDIISDEDDLNDYNKLKIKTEQKLGEKGKS